MASEPNPFPAVCGRVCTHKCETDCTRGEIEQPHRHRRPQALRHRLRLRQRAAARAGRAHVQREGRHRRRRPERPHRRPRPGPAGLPDAPSSRAKPEPGGMLRFGIPEYRLPKAALQQDIDRILALGVELQCGKAAGTDFTVDVPAGATATRPSTWASACRAAARCPSPATTPRASSPPSSCCKRRHPRQARRHGQERGRHRRRRRGLRRRPHGRCAWAPTRSSSYCIEDDADHAGLGRRDRRGPRRVDQLHLLVHADRRRGRRPRPRQPRSSSPPARWARPDARGWRPPVRHRQHRSASSPATPSSSPSARAWSTTSSRAPTASQVERGQIVTDKQLGHRQGRRVRRRRRRGHRPLDGHRGRRRRPPRRPRSIHNFLRGEELARLETTSPWTRPSPTTTCWPRPQVMARMPMPHLAGAARKLTWDEVNTGFSAEQAVAEAKRCLNCAVCSECMECVRACGPGALLHGERDKRARRRGGRRRAGHRLRPLRPRRQERVRLRPLPQHPLGAGVRAHAQRLRPHDRRGQAPLRRRAPQEDRLHPVRGLARPGARVLLQRLLHVRQQAGHAHHRPRARRASPTSSSWTCAPRARASTPSTSAPRTWASSSSARVPRYIKEDPLTNDLLISWEDEAGKLHADALRHGRALGRPGACAQGAARRPATSASPSTVTASASCTNSSRCRPAARACSWWARSASPRTSPTRVAQASAAAAKVMTGLADSRGTLTVDKEYPTERDVVGEEPRVGVFVCHCGSNIAGVIDVESVAEYALQAARRGLRHTTPCTRAPQTACTLIREKIEEHDLNRVVVASCTPRTHEPIFQDTLREAGLNPFLFEMANIRDQASWVHRKEPEKATDKAKDLIRMSVARARLLEPLFKIDVPLTHAAVVIGGGVAGMTAATALGDMGHEVHLVERSDKLGGLAHEIDEHHQGQRPRPLWWPPSSSAHRQPQRQDPHAGRARRLPRLHRQLLERHRGEGRQAHRRRPRRRHRRHRLAARTAPTSTAWAPARRSSPGSSSSTCSGTTTPALAKDVRSAGFILCAGSLDESHPYCSRTCCQQSIKNAITLKEQDPEPPGLRVVQGGPHLRPLRGVLHEGARAGRHLHALRQRHTAVAVSANGSVSGRAYRDPYLGRDIDLPLDLLVLATPTIAAEGSQRAQQDAQGAAARRRLLPRGARQAAPRGLRQRGHLPVRRRPLPQEHRGDHQPGLRRRGHEPPPSWPSPSSRPAAWSPRSIRRSAPPASRACASAPTRCPSSIPIAKKAKIEAAACQGCGVCVSECPVKAITLHHYTDAQIFAKEEALFMEVS